MNGLKQLARQARNSLGGLRDRWSLERRKQRRRANGRQAFARHGLLNGSTDTAYADEVVRYWSEHYGRQVDPLWHTAFAKVTGKRDVRFVPHDIWFEELLPFFNNVSMRPAYIDKNLSDVLLGDVAAPATVVKRVHGHYYDAADRWISPDQAWQAVCSGPPAQIAKPSLTDNGFGVRQIDVADGRVTMGGEPLTLDRLADGHGRDFIVQAKIQQHAVMAAPHPSSVNTIRMVTLRWQDRIHPLVAFARFGTGGKLTDNAGTGGVVCGIGDDGRLDTQAADEYGGVHLKHPTTGYDFAGHDATVPNFAELRATAVRLHEKIKHFDLVSWDFAIDAEGRPLFLEINFQGVSYIYQFAARRPVFGELTAEVLQAARQAREGRQRFGAFRP